MVFQQQDHLHMAKVRYLNVNKRNTEFVNLEPNSKRWFDLNLLPNEEFKRIKNYEELYEVSNYGRIKSLKRTTTHERILKCSYTKRGYGRVCLCKNNNKKNFFIHSLVMSTFYENFYKDGLQINHKDENKHNNCIYNLEWCDNVYNINYGTGILRSKQKKYKPVEQYTMNGIFVNAYESIQAASINVSRKHNKSGVHRISKCAKGQLSSYKGFKWCFSETEVL